MKFLTLEQFTEMWKLQDELNTVTSGPNWKDLNQNWNLAIKSEVMEFFDYIGWKWWKEPEKTKKPSDMQARLELVDIWHFFLSGTMEYCHEYKETADEAFNFFASPANGFPEEGNITSVQRLDELNLPLDDAIWFLNESILACEWSWDELYKAYIGKVALNNFRQANGYKEGTYQKDWLLEYTDLGEIRHEDNFFLERILSSGHPVSYENTMNGLMYYYAGEHLI